VEIVISVLYEYLKKNLFYNLSCGSLLTIRAFLRIPLRSDNVVIRKYLNTKLLLIFASVSYLSDVTAQAGLRWLNFIDISTDEPINVAKLVLFFTSSTKYDCSTAAIFLL